MDHLSATSSAESHRRFALGVEIVIAVPPIRVWKALLEPEDLKHWFCEYADVEPRPDGRFKFGGRYTYRLDTPEDEGQALLGLETGRSARFTWSIGGAPTEVSLETLSVPFHDGVQPPESRMNASSNAFWPRGV